MVTGYERLQAGINRHARSIFLLAISLYTLFLIYESFSYGPEARLFPLIANSLLIGLIILEAIVDRYGDRLDLGSGGLFSTATDETEDILGLDSDRSVEREYEMLGWIVGFIFVIWLFGFYSSFLLVPLFVYVYERDLRLTIYTLILVVVLLNLFVIVLEARLWEGVWVQLL